MAPVVPPAEGSAADADDALDVGSDQALAQHTLTDHAGRTKQEDVHSKVAGTSSDERTSDGT